MGNTLFPQDAVVVVNGATSLPFPPIVAGGDVSRWERNGAAVYEFDLDVWSTGSVDLTSAELFGGALHPGTIADDAFTTVFGTGIFTAAAHGLITGDGPIQFTTSDTLPAGLELATDYWVIHLSADTFKPALSLEDALAGTPVAITDDGTGTHTLVDTVDTKRMHLHSCGLLGIAADGAIELTSRRAYNVRVEHRPDTLAYWIGATLSGAVAVYASATPVQR